MPQNSGCQQRTAQGLTLVLKLETHIAFNKSQSWVTSDVAFDAQGDVTPFSILFLRGRS